MYVGILVIDQSNLDTITIISYNNDNLDQIKLIFVHFQVLYILFYFIKLKMMKFIYMKSWW